MKRFIIICSSITLLLQAAIAQTGAHNAIDSSNIEKLLSKARCYLQGGACTFDPAKAFQLNMECANAGSAKAMNAIAIQYQKGLGVDSNNTEAVKWFTKAAEAGYSTAWYNLALHYKYDSPVDFAKAYQCFAKAANAGHLGGYYGQGYLLYKGLGVKQDYKRAVALFQAGAYAGDAPCMYYLGLALRNGYGITANADSAKYWLEKAMALGYTRSKNELRSSAAEVNGESSNISERIGEAKRKLLPGSNDEIGKYKQVDHVTATIHNIPGLWEGYILKYDWSGKHVISAGKLSLQLSCKDTLIKSRRDQCLLCSLAVRRPQQRFPKPVQIA
jgi:TPR repeat protein